ncbi:hypothetical protein IHE55_17495 [Streptomyces pactum]|uniref:Uncharacterized protein n=1 Tax=Streptomyces pactum TaxID=68249 RepID=A0ABS0NMQ6_9ACTN|nr:hypothetical protein [Streptomyces pactum]MBH5336472.1 hypothetical protein [Streptomyces pactum]
MRDTLVLFIRADQHGVFRQRMSRYTELEPGEHFRYYSQGDCVFGASETDVLADYDDEELATVRLRLGGFRSVLIEYASMECLRDLLEYLLPGLDGIIDTNYDSFASFDKTLLWLAANPGRRLRQDPPNDIPFP